MPRKPIKLAVANMEKLLTAQEAMPITSAYFKERTSDSFDPNGLFSEEIFGSIGDQQRLIRFGYIDLHTELLHPKIYEVVTQLKALYKHIISGKQHAYWDSKAKDFVKCNDDDEGADTGYMFFVSHLEEIDFKKTKSAKRNTRIKLIEDSKANWHVKRFIVSPAGTREYTINKDGRDEYDEINKLYKRIIEMTRALENVRTNSKMYDGIKYRLQLVLNEVYESLWFFFSKVFFPKKYNSRSIALATRNVISAADIDAPADNPAARLSMDELMTPLWQVLGGAAPVVKRHLLTFVFNPIFEEDSNQCTLVDPDTLETVTVEVSSATKKRHLDLEDMNYLLHSFLESTDQHVPFTIPDKDGKEHYVLLRYIDEDDGVLYLSRSITSLKEGLERLGKTFNKLWLAPMTRYELFYRSAYHSTLKVHVTFTRYPVLGHLGIGLYKVHVVTTSKFRKVTIRDLTDSDYEITLPRWPIAGSANMGGCTPHPCHLGNFVADHDGDQNNSIFILSDDANNEIEEFLNSPRFIISPDMQSYVGVDTTLTSKTLYNLTCGLDLGLTP